MEIDGKPQIPRRQESVVFDLFSFSSLPVTKPTLGQYKPTDEH